MAVIVAFGTYDAQRHPRIGIVIDGLRTHDIEVTELNHPLGLSTADRVRMLKQPWRLPALAWRLVSRWRSLLRDARALLASGVAVDAVIVGYLGHFDVLLARRLFRRNTIVLDHLVFAGDTAHDRGARGLRVRLLRALDRRAISAADIVMLDTPEHAAMLPTETVSVVVPVGARTEWFSAGAAAPASPSSDKEGMSVVFFGLFTPLQGAPVIASALAEALDRTPHLTATLIGRGQDWDAARAALGDRADVAWVDWVEPSELPAIVADHDVCLGIFGTSEKALRVVPNKVYEGAAAGCALITSDTRPQRALIGDAAVFTPPGDASALADALVDLAASPTRLALARATARARADEFSAAQIVLPLLQALAERR